jgi:tRNA G46 methylase TrmB
VLDVACGTGVWILEMAHEFPHAQFYGKEKKKSRADHLLTHISGFDLSEIFPTAIRPNNTFFCLYDMNQGLPYPDCFFDFIHMKDVFACFPATATKVKRRKKKGGRAGHEILTKVV